MPKKDISKQDKKEKKEKKHFFKDFKAELKKVIWPTPKQLVNNTVAVITIVLITALIVFVLDLTFESINNYGINHLKSAVESYQAEHQNTENTEGENNAEGVENAENSTETNSDGTNTTDTNTTNDNAENE